MCGSPMKSDDSWRRESDHRTLMDAAEIQGDRKRMSGVKAHHKSVSKKHSLVGRALMKSGRR